MAALDLSLVPILDLANELNRRADAMLLIIAHHADGKPDQTTINDFVKGDAYSPFGLLRQLQAQCEAHYRKNTGRNL